MSEPVAGWYPDPHVPQQMRWWDGQVWSDDTYERTLPFEGQPPLEGQPQPGAATAAPGARAPGAQDARATSAHVLRDGVHGDSAATGVGAVGTTTRSQGARQGARQGVPAARSTIATTEDGAPLASWGRRAAARVVDVVLTTLIGLLVTFPVTGDLLARLQQLTDEAAATGRAPAFDVFDDPELLRIGAIFTIVQIGVSLGYQMAFLLWKAATPGKLLLGLRVRRLAADTPLTHGTILRRWFGSDGVSAIGYLGSLYYVADVLWPLRDSHRQALHDKVAGTCVVTTPR